MLIFSKKKFFKNLFRTNKKVAFSVEEIENEGFVKYLEENNVFVKAWGENNKVLKLYLFSKEVIKMILKIFRNILILSF